MMRLKITFITGLLLSSLSAVAQQQKPPAFIGINGGISLPMGNWSMSNYNNDKSGFAGVGSQFSLDGAYFFSKHIGVGALVNYSVHKVERLGAISAGFVEDFEVEEAHTTANGYEVWNFMPGLYFNFPVSKVSITARALAGVMHATTPHIAVTLVDDEKEFGPAVQEESTANSFGFDMGAGVSYPVISNLAINLKADYFYSNPDFKIENTGRQNKAGRLISEYHQPLTGVNISLGVAYSFNKK